MGAEWGSVAARVLSHCSSPHSCWLSVTIEAVAGGVSVAKAIGSAFSRQRSSAPKISYLYRVPAVTLGIKISQTPEEPRERMACEVPSQWLKSPITRTARALGAQTLNEVPETSPKSLGKLRTCAPSTRHNSSCRPSPIRCKSTSPNVGGKL